MWIVDEKDHFQSWRSDTALVSGGPTTARAVVMPIYTRLVNERLLKEKYNHARRYVIIKVDGLRHSRGLYKEATTISHFCGL